MIGIFVILGLIGLLAILAAWLQHWHSWRVAKRTKFHSYEVCRDCDKKRTVCYCPMAHKEPMNLSWADEVVKK